MMIMIIGIRITNDKNDNSNSNNNNNHRDNCTHYDGEEDTTDFGNDSNSSIANCR